MDHDPQHSHCSTQSRAKLRLHWTTPMVLRFNRLSIPCVTAPIHLDRDPKQAGTAMIDADRLMVVGHTTRGVNSVLEGKVWRVDVLGDGIHFSRIATNLAAKTIHVSYKDCTVYHKSVRLHPITKQILSIFYS